MALQRWAALSLLAGGSVALYPRQTAFAEEPRSTRTKKAIYDDYPSEASEQTSSSSTFLGSVSNSDVATATPSTTPTDLLAVQVRQARLFLYAQSLAVETKFNSFLSRALHIENAFTDTIASLAPPPESQERLLPGGVYVAVTAMAGSIVSRNRGIFLRTASPVAFGTVAAWTLLPVTMRNVADLVWKYELKVPALAEQHLKVREQAEYLWHTGVAHSSMARSMMEEKIGDARRKLEEIVSKGH